MTRFEEDKKKVQVKLKLEIRVRLYSFIYSNIKDQNIDKKINIDCRFKGKIQRYKNPRGSKGGYY